VLINVAEVALSFFWSVDAETGVEGEAVFGFRAALDEGLGIGVSSGFVTGTFTEGDWICWFETTLDPAGADIFSLFPPVHAVVKSASNPTSNIRRVNQ